MAGDHAFLVGRNCEGSDRRTVGTDPTISGAEMPGGLHMQFYP